MLEAPGGRRIRYLRLSVTGRCQLACVYCGEAEGGDSPLSPSDFGRLAEVALSLGIYNFRITGGEPVLREDLLEIVGRISELGPGDLSLTTNGIELSDSAHDLRRAGLRRVNIGLPALDRELYLRMTGVDALDRALEGVDAALREGLLPVKVNVVLVRGMNDSQVEDFVRFSREKGVVVRFIEVMPFGIEDGLVPADEVLKRLGPGEDVEVVGSGPAEYFRRDGALVGLITPITRPFCERCDRLRVTAEGKLVPCITSDFGEDMVRAIGEGKIEEAFRRVVKYKPLRYGTFHGSMRLIGG